MGSAVIALRVVRPEDHDRLRELTFQSKAYWGYDHDLVRGWADELELPTGDNCWVAEDDGTIAAWAALTPPRDGVAILDHLWVAPHAMGRGIGSKLFELAADRARRLGASRLEWSAEVHAVGFYEKVGGRKLRDHVTDWGRTAPWMGLEL
jgi:GNAT superfamily N-acetyltransferase